MVSLQIFFEFVAKCSRIVVWLVTLDIIKDDSRKTHNRSIDIHSDE